MATAPTQAAPDRCAAEGVPPRPPFWRAITVGLLLIPFSTYYGNYAYVVVQALLWGQTALLRGPVFVLFGLALGNLLVRRLARRAGLQPWEMLIVYSMVAISVCVSGFGMLQWLINILPAGQYYATRTNHYERFLFLVPPYLIPHDPRVVDDFFRGHTTMYRADVLRDWAAPVCVWSAFIVALCWVTLCLTSLIRRQWTDEEKLTFPLVYLPLEMARAGAGETAFFRSRLMWAGFILAGLLESVDYLNFFYPGVPYIPIKPNTWHLQDGITTHPWNSVGMFTLAFYPFALGIAFFLSREVSFSCWFFYLLTRVENVGVAALGLNQGGSAVRGGAASPPFLGEQGVGAFVALGLFLLWRARHPLALAARALWDRRAAAEGDDPYAPLSPRVAFWGGLVGVALLTAFLTAFGLPLWVSLLFWALYLLVVLVLTRVIAEAGAGWAWGPMLPIHTTVMDVVGGGLSPRTLTLFGYLAWFDVEFRDSPMPHQLEAMKLAQDTRTPRRQLLWALLIAAAVSVVLAFWTYLHIYYEFGAASAKVRPALQGLGPGTFKQVDNWLRNPRPPDGGALGAMAAGAAVVLALAGLRQRLVWWPLHPIGYALAGTTSMEYMWCPFFLAWLVKTAVLRYGGVALYRQLLPFALGLILGDYVVPTIWGLWGTLEGTQVYMAFPH